MCGSEPCYKKSKRTKQVCRRIYDNVGNSIFDYFSTKLSISSVLPLIVVALLVLIAISAVASFVIRDYPSGSHSDQNNLFGDLFSSLLFLVIICLLSFQTFNPESFCLMNPRERMCNPYRESLSCAHTHNLNITTQMGNYYDGYAGFFQKNTDKGLAKRNPLKCFLDIGQDSWFQFVSLDFGKNKRWTESSFVLIDGEFAPFQPKISFRSLPRIIFGWLFEQNIPLNFDRRTSSTGIIVFAADSEVKLVYHAAEMTGFE